MTPRDLAMALALLAGAACVPAYVNPTRDDAARLLLVPRPDTTYQPAAYGFIDGKDCRNRLNLVGKGDLEAKTEIRLVPGEEFTVLGMFGDPAHWCAIAMTFMPRPRESYAAVIGGNSTRCTLGIVRWDGKGFIPESSARKRAYRAPRWSASDQQCDVQAPSAAAALPVEGP